MQAAVEWSGLGRRNASKLRASLRRALPLQTSHDVNRPRLTALYLRVLVIKQGEQWLAQALDYNLSAQAPSDDQAVQAFIRILRARLRMDHERGKTPLQGLPQAPDRFFEVWERLERELHDGLVTEPASEPEEGIPPAYVIKQIVNADGADLH